MTLIEQLDAVLEKILPAASYQCGAERFVTDNADTLRAALKDAERYRWLRDRMAVEDIPDEHPDWSTPSEEESRKVDSAIDARIEGGTK